LAPPNHGGPNIRVGAKLIAVITHPTDIFSENLCIISPHLSQYYNINYTRKNMSQIFYTKPKIEGNCVSYLEDVSLRNYIDHVCEEIDCSILQQYLLTNLIDHPDDKQLIRIWEYYLRNRCVIVVKREYYRLSGYLTEYNLAYLFDLTYVLLKQRFFAQEKYKHKIPANFMIKDCFRKQIRKYLNRNFGITNLGIAVRSSRKLWLEVAHDSLEIEQYPILRGCVKHFSNLGLPCNTWTDNHFQEIANQFNKLSPNSPPLTGENVENILDLVGKKIRELVDHPPCISIDQSIIDEINFPLINIIPSPNNDYQDDSYSEEIELLTEFINLILTTFETQNQKIAFYHFALKFTQIKTATELEINQSTVSRLGTLIYQTLFLSFHPTHSETIKPTSEQLKYLKESLKDFYDRQIKQVTLNNHLLNTEYIIKQIQTRFQLETLTENAINKLRELIEEILQFYHTI
jgi:hypothetical protein